MSDFPWVEMFYAFCAGSVIGAIGVMHFLTEPHCDDCDDTREEP